MFRTSNPALREGVFESEARGHHSEGVMTIQGTVNKSFVLLLLVVVCAAWAWIQMSAGLIDRVAPLMMGGAILGLIAGIVLVIKKEWAPVLAPVYAIAQGLFVGGLSSVLEARYPGIVVQAVGLTFGTLFCLLGAYKSGMIAATQRFKMGIVAATGGIAIFYLVSLVLSLFGMNLSFITGNGIFSIGLSAIVVVIAALNLVLDFDFIEQGSAVGAPKYMEWFGAFGLMVTLIWLYVEILRLLSKLASRRD